MSNGSRINRDIALEDLSGLLYAQYIRESTTDQGDRFGPDAQRRQNTSWADRYGLLDSGLEYSEWVSGKSLEPRTQIQRAITDLKAGKYRVLLVTYSDRLARNQADALEIKRQIAEAGGYVVFTSTGIIAGQKQFKLVESIYAAIDEGYSEVLADHMTDALYEKFRKGGANGRPPFGARHRYVRKDGSLAGGPEKGSTAWRELA